MKEPNTRRAEAPKRERAAQTPQAESGPETRSGEVGAKTKVVVIDGGLHSRLKARAATEGVSLQTLVETKLNELFEPAVAEVAR